MRLRHLLSAAALGIAAIGLGGCATGLNTTVSRYQQMPAPQGQTFIVVPGQGLADGGLEFQRYAGLVAQHLQARGYQPSLDAKTANFVVHLDYGVDNGQTRIVEDPFAYRRNRFGWGDPFYSGFYYPRFGYRSRYSWGWDDPFWYGGYGSSGIRSYVEYHSSIGLHIRMNGTNTPLFDGRAIARSRTNRLDVTLPSLIDAMFTGFPGRNGETVRITVPSANG